MTWVTTELRDAVHVHPFYEAGHILGPWCWCEPREEYEGERPISSTATSWNGRCRMAKSKADRNMLTYEQYRDIRSRLFAAGYADEYEWSQNVTAPRNGSDFFAEYAFVVCNSGMKAQIAVGIYRKILAALGEGRAVSEAFGHPGKAAAIQDVWERRDDYYAAYLAAENKVEHLGTLPWIGPITKWHLAKNFGVDCAKPDRHLVRLAAAEGCSVDELCQRLAVASGDRVATVDLVLWRAANLGWIAGGREQMEMSA